MFIICNHAEKNDDCVFIICKTIAEELDRAETKGPLHGLPFSVKDQLPMKVCTLEVVMIPVKWTGKDHIKISKEFITNTKAVSWSFCQIEIEVL